MQNEKLELLKPHTHAGTLLEPGDVIELPADLARWLCNAGIAKPHKLSPSSKTQSNREENP
jgi:hypothetical protein